jgi:hypothetical protein
LIRADCQLLSAVCCLLSADNQLHGWTASASRYKKPLQNAIIIELAGDLNELEVDPAALFDFGNLQGE